MTTAVASSGLDNDTRGWIMCVVSGIGKSHSSIYPNALQDAVTDIQTQPALLAPP